MRMPAQGFTFTDAVTERHATTNCQELLSGTDPLYNQIAEQTAQAVGQFTNPAKQGMTALMPVAYFGIRAATQTLLHQELAPLLPTHVEARGNTARNCSSIMIARALRSGALLSYYNDNEVLAPLLKNDPRRVLRQLLDPGAAYEAHLIELGDVAILDETIVAGGALCFLQRKHRAMLEAEETAEGESGAAAIVGRSIGLQLVARVLDDNLEGMRINMGMPYTDPAHFVLRDNVVDFTKKTRTYLHGLIQPGGGCPAHRALTSDTATQPTFLRMVWADLAKLLLPPNAKAELPPQKRPPKPRKKR